MKAFRFSLEKVLVWRRLRKEQELAKLEALINERAQFIRRHDDLRSNRASIESGLASSAAVEQRNIATMPQWQRQTIASIAYLANEKQRLDALIAAQRGTLTEADRQVRLLEQLREKRYGLWKAGLLREEENFAGEAFLARFARERG